jgi:hypothetical protein
LVSFVSMAVMMWCFDLLLEWHLLGSGPRTQHYFMANQQSQPMFFQTPCT